MRHDTEDGRGEGWDRRDAISSATSPSAGPTNMTFSAAASLGSATSWAVASPRSAISIFKAGTSGFKFNTNIKAMLMLGFNTTNVDNYNGYIQHNNLDLFVVLSLPNYKVAIVGMAPSTKEVSYVTSKDTPYAGRSYITRSISRAFHVGFFAK